MIAHPYLLAGGSERVAALIAAARTSEFDWLESEEELDVEIMEDPEDPEEVAG